MLHTLRGLYDTYSLTNLPEALTTAPAPVQELLNIVRKPNPSRADLEPAFELCKRIRTLKSLPSSFFAFPGPLIREIVHFFDRVALAKDQIRAYLAISETVAHRKDYLPTGVSIKILPAPTDLAAFECRSGKYFFTASRLNNSKRVGLLIDAMAHLPFNARLKIAGSGSEENSLKKRCANDPRIQFLGHVPDSELTDLYANSIAVLFAPFDEDYGLVALEAMKSGKPVITTTDSGGVRELVRNNETGIVTDPYPPALAKAMERLINDPALTTQMGSRGRELAQKINWRDNVNTLLGYIEKQNSGARRIILVAAPFAADRHGSGGPRRLYHFCVELAKEFEVKLVCVGSQIQKSINRREHGPHFLEISCPWTEAALDEAAKLDAMVDASADEIAILRHAAKYNALKECLRQEGAQAICIVLSHPWLYGAASAALPTLPMVYDAHNVESDLKSDIFGANSVIAVETTAIEAKVCQKANLVFACSRKDGDRLIAKYSIAPDKLHILANGCETGHVRHDRIALRKRLPYPLARLALFIGSGHKPNLDAAFAILKMAQQLPQVEFLLAGSVTTQRPFREAERPPNVHLLGIISENVKNLLLEAADLGLNPVVAGSGVNLKSVEYISCGLPCISTQIGMRGLPMNLEPAVKIAELADFPERINDFFAARPQTEEIEKICRCFGEQYDWEKTLKLLRPEINNLCAKFTDPV